MEKKIINKMARYVELSKKFSKSDRDIFTEEEFQTLNKCNGITSGSGIVSGYNTTINIDNSCGNYTTFSGPVIIDDREIYIDEKGNVKSKDPKKPLTRGERLEANTLLEVKSRAVLLDEYDEYMKLRTSLNTYFNGVDNLINK